jgi:hypothetical protein
MLHGGRTERRTVLWLYIFVTAAVIVMGAPTYFVALFELGFANSLFWRLFALLAFLVLLASYFVLWFRLPDVDTQPRESLRAIARMLRTTGYSVDEHLEYLDVRVDRLSHLKIRASEVASGTRLDFQVGTTPLSATVIVVMFLVYPPISILLSVASVWTIFGFVEKRLAPRLAGIPAVASAPMDVRATLIDSLSEGHRISREAYESVKSNYEDLMIVVAVLGMLFFFAGFFASQWTISSGTTVSLVMGALTMLGFTVPVALRVRSRHVKTISRFERYARRLDGALSLELTGSKPPDGYPSSFEIISGAGEQFPAWLAARRRAGMYRRPATWVAIFVFAYLGVMALFVGIVGLLSGWSEFANSVIVCAAGGAMILATILLYFHWREEERKEAERLTRDWDGRLEILRAEMEKCLQGL